MDIQSANQTHKKHHPTHVIDANNIEIIDKADSRFKILIKEMLHISSNAPLKCTKTTILNLKLNLILKRF